MTISGISLYTLYNLYNRVHVLYWPASMWCTMKSKIWQVWPCVHFEMQTTSHTLNVFPAFLLFAVTWHACPEIVPNNARHMPGLQHLGLQFIFKGSEKGKCFTSQTHVNLQSHLVDTQGWREQRERGGNWGKWVNGCRWGEEEERERIDSHGGRAV